MYVYCLQSSELVVDLCEVALVTIDVLPDLALLEVFDFYVDGEYMDSETWQTLVQVCRKWRNIVFGSPRRLKLRLFCSGTLWRRKLDVWPPLPIVVRSDGPGSVDDIVAALEHNDRISGHGYLLSYRVMAAASITLLRHLSITIAYVGSISLAKVLPWKKSWQQCNSHFRY
jgi:hypothetical protein